VSLVINEEWEPPNYVYDGQKVVAPYTHEGKRRGLWCKVAVAAGNHARVVNKEFGVDRWLPIACLRVETPRGPRALKRLRDPVEP
jgi:hypothetical protein